MARIFHAANGTINLGLTWLVKPAAIAGEAAQLVSRKTPKRECSFLAATLWGMSPEVPDN